MPLGKRVDLLVSFSSFKIVLIFILNSFSLWADDCTRVGPLFDQSKHGKRHIQYDTSMCYAFSLSHVLAIITGKSINPLDVVYQFKKYTSRGGRISPHEFRFGARPKDYTDKFVSVLLARGLCSDQIDPAIGKLLKRDNIIQEAVKLRCDQKELKYTELGAITEVYRKMVEGLAGSCKSERLFIHGLRPLYLGFQSPSEVNIDPEGALRAVDKFLGRGSPLVLNTSNKLFGENNGGYHAIALIGRRRNRKTGICEYLLLDSSPPSECQGHVAEEIEKDCERGEYWVSREFIKKYGSSLIGFRFRRKLL